MFCQNKVATALLSITNHMRVAFGDHMPHELADDAHPLQRIQRRQIWRRVRHAGGLVLLLHLMRCLAAKTQHATLQNPARWCMSKANEQKLRPHPKISSTKNPP